MGLFDKLLGKKREEGSWIRPTSIPELQERYEREEKIRREHPGYTTEKETVKEIEAMNEEITEIMERNPQITPGKIASLTGMTESEITELLKKYAKKSDKPKERTKYENYDEEKLEEIKRINRENWEKAQHIKDQPKRPESSELDKKQEVDPVQMCWKFLDEYNKKMDVIWNGGGSLEDKRLEKLEQDFIQFIEKLNSSDASIAVLEAILSPQNMKVWSDVHTAAKRKQEEFLSMGKRFEIKDIEEKKPKKDVENLINALKDEDMDVRWKAASALSENGWVPRNRTEGGYYSIAKRKLHIPSLIRHLSDVGWESCSSAASALGDIAELAPDVIKPVIPEIINNLSDKDKFVSGGAALAIVNISEKSPEVLKSAVPNLIGFLDTTDEKVRRAAVFAIGMVGGKDPEVVKYAIPKLINFLEDEDEYVRKNAAEGIT